MTFTQTTKSGKGRTKWYTWPLIVPPIFEKGTYLNRALEPVWLAAWQALSEADRLVIYGYSFPAADEQTRAFFRRLAGEWESHPSLVTINPDFGAATRANDLLAPPTHLHTSSVARLLSSAKGIVVG